jgi:hypothetical protein
MKESVKVFFNNDVFMGKVKKFSVSFPPGAYREYTWLIVESEPFNPEVKKFNTFNFKQAKTPTKINFVLVTPSTELLLKCNPVYNCQKFKVACVIAWQKQLTADGFYGTKGYNIDGQYCTFTKSETERWQKHYKIKQTGVFDKATKAVLEKRFGKTDMTSDITKVLQKIDQMGR